MTYRIHQDGSFDLIGESITLLSCYPSLDGRPLRAKAVEISASECRYTLESGSLTVGIVCDRDGRIGVSCRITPVRPIHDLSPVSGASVEGARRLYVQGFGMEGPSGCFEPGEDPTDSFGLTAFAREDRVLLC